MIAEGGYFDGSRDAILMAGSLIHDSLDSICDSTEIAQGNFHGPSFFIEDICNPTNLTSEPARTINHIQHRAEFDMDQDLHGHMIQETQIPRYSMTTAFPSTEHIFGDPGQNAGNQLDINNDVLGRAIHDSGMMLGDLTLPLQYNGNQSHLFKDLYHSLPQSFGLFSSDDERDRTMGVVGAAGNILQEIDGRQFGSPKLGRSKKGGFGKAKANFATEKERREQINVKYGALRSLLPSPTKNDRASIVGDAIEYINELNRTLKELTSLVEGDTKHRMKMLKLDDAARDNGESSSLQQVKDDQDSQLNGAIRSSWIQRRSKECHVDVRIVGNEINIKFTEKKKTNSLLCAAKVIDEFRLELIHVVGGIIGDQRIFMFNTKISEGSSVYASALASKLLRAMEMEHLAVDIFS
ncbi:unnamed protein product [Triticum turgidum subsp. durum]|uniref:BHLH domain-containing protein n=1 Tax=Triticum turgidum subsp. durum TaxID=4567 RepID=A0A9R1B1S8_TRITD|nr:unnamed protein product [Triticum turgidum subsp. durum]